MPNWDIFHSDRLEVERNLDRDKVRMGIGRGEITSDDLVRTTGSNEPWVRLSEGPGLWAMFTGASADMGDEGAAVEGEAQSLRDLMVDDATEALDTFDEDDGEPRLLPRHQSGTTLSSGIQKATTEDLDTRFPEGYDRDLDLSLRDPRHTVTLDHDGDLTTEDDYDPEAEDDEAAGFTFTRGGAETVEELDLAAMVDVAFQLVLFFLVTASTIIFKTIEVPPPKQEDKKSGATQQIGAKTMAEAAVDNILVEVDSNGEIKIDHEKAPNDFNGLVARLREVSRTTQRNGILLTSESSTKHKNAVKVLDAASEISLSISLAQPVAAPEKAPVPTPAAK